METGLILGASGLVGNALIQELGLEYHVYGTYFNHKIPSYEKTLFFDVNKPEMLDNIIEKVQPQWIISCLRGDYAKQLDVHKKAALYLKRIKGHMYYCSTANVFDQDVSQAHDEKAVPASKSEYGQFKVQCEQLLKATLAEKATILRLPMLWGKNSRRFNELRRKLAQGEAIDVYSNLYLNHNTDAMLAKQIHYIIDHQLQGIFHLASEDIMTQETFVRDLIIHLGYSSVKLTINNLPEDKYYLALESKYQKLPLQLTYTIQDIVAYLVQK